MGSPWAEKKLKPSLVVGRLKEFKAQFYFIRKLNNNYFCFKFFLKTFLLLWLIKPEPSSSSTASSHCFRELQFTLVQLHTYNSSILCYVHDLR